MHKYMKISGIVASVIFAICVLSCSDNALLEKLDLAESVIQDRPDSALAIIRSIDTLLLDSESIRARYSLLYAMALDKNYIDTTDVAVIEPAVKYYSKHGSAREKLKTYYYSGRIYANAKDIRQAAIAYSIAEKEVQIAADPEAEGLLYSGLASLYNKTKNNERELECVEKCIRAFERAGNKRNLDLSIGRKAIVYYSMQSWAKADSLFKIGIQKAAYDTVAMSVFLPNYARMKVVMPNQDGAAALSLLNDLAYKYKQPFSTLDYGVYAYASILTGDEQTCRSIEKYFDSLDEPTEGILFFRAMIEQARKNYSKALDYFIQSYTLNTKHVDDILSNTVEEALKEHYKATAADIERDAQILRLKIVSVFSLIILILLAIFLFYRHNRQKKQLVFEQKLEALRMSVVSAHKEKFSAIGDLCDAYLLAKDRTDQKEIIYKRVERLVAFASDDDKFHAKFEAQINKDFNDIVKHLKSDLGTVDKAESRFICYNIIGFKPNIIGAILGISSNNVYTRRNRLKERISNLDSPYKKEYMQMFGFKPVREGPSTSL